MSRRTAPGAGDARRHRGLAPSLRRRYPCREPPAPCRLPRVRQGRRAQAPDGAHAPIARVAVAESSFNAEHAGAGTHDTPLPKEFYSINRLTAGWRLPELPKRAQWVAPPEGRDAEEI